MFCHDIKSLSSIKSFCNLFASLLILFGKDISAFLYVFVTLSRIFFFHNLLSWFHKNVVSYLLKKNVFQWTDQFNFFFQLFWNSFCEGLDLMDSIIVCTFFSNSFISWYCRGHFLVFKLKCVDVGHCCWHLYLSFVDLC